jgi:hypothetical protein
MLLFLKLRNFITLITIMKFLPYEDFYIITGLKPNEVQQRLENEVSPGDGRLFKFGSFSSPSGTYFEGFAVNGMFEVKHSISYRNSFLPQIKGTTEAYLNGSRVHVKMKMLAFVTVFMCFWMSFVTLAAVVVLSTAISKKQFNAVALMPFVMFLFGYALTMGGFKYESRSAKYKLLEILDGEIA